MKKSSWAAIALAVVLLAAAGGWLVVRTVESTTEQAVRDMLAALSASAERVDYSLLSNTLNLDGVAYARGGQGLSASVAVGHIRVTGFDRACLDASFNGGELPLVADSLVAADVEIRSSSLGVDSQERIAEIRVEGWYQNLGKLAALYQREPWSEAFFAEACRYRLEMLAGKDSRVVLSIPSQNAALSMSRAMFGLLGPAGSRSAASEEGRTISLFVNDVRAGLDQDGGHVERVEVRDLRLPSPACASRLAGLMGKLQKLSAHGDLSDTSEAILEISEAMGRELGRDYWNSTPYGEIVLRGFSVTSGDADMRLDEMRHRLSLAEPWVFGLDLSGLHGSWDAMPLEWRRAGSAFLPDGPLMDGSLELTFRPRRQPSSVTWSAGVRNLGRAEGAFSLELNTDIAEMLNLLKNWGTHATADWAARNVFLKEAEASYADQGLAALAVTLSALHGGTSVEREWNSMKAVPPVLGEDLGEIGPMLEKAAATMLERPGTLNIQCRPEKTLSLGALLMALLLQPESLHLAVTAEPGEKSLLDWVPPSLRQ